MPGKIGGLARYPEGMAVTGEKSSYKDAGVDIDLAGSLLARMKGSLAAATRPEVLAPVGGFGGLFQLDLSRFQAPVMVSSIDSVGTKVMVAHMTGRHDSVGHDIVNHCINDIAVQGAEPLFFLDYLGIGKLRSPLYEDMLTGVAEACRRQGVALLGGETAEMPGMYGDDYDLVGCIIGAVEKDRLITGERIQAGHILIGLPSNGPHTNGFSLARQVLFERAGHGADTHLEALGTTVGEALMQPHTCYWPAIRDALAAELPLDGIAHITGGGLYDNIPRILPPGIGVELDLAEVACPPIFRVIQELGQVDAKEMHRVFNMGVGMVWLVAADAADEALRLCRDAGFAAVRVGKAVAGDNEVRIRDLG